MTRRLLWIFTIAALIGIFVIPLNPVNSRLLRLAWLGAITGAWLGLLLIYWRHRLIRNGMITLPVLATIPFLLPKREFDTKALREDYVRRLSTFEGTKYYWGGEGKRGIDCSGLPRRALRDALLSYGIQHADGGALRMALSQWWFDASAKALGKGYRGNTQPLRPVGTIRTMDYTGLLPGDLAVTTNGVHILAYAGGDKWIQAEPGVGAVITLDGRTADNHWFDFPVTTHRWSVLDD